MHTCIYIDYIINVSVHLAIFLHLQTKEYQRVESIRRAQLEERLNNGNEVNAPFFRPWHTYTLPANMLHVYLTELRASQARTRARTT